MTRTKIPNYNTKRILIQMLQSDWLEKKEAVVQIFHGGPGIPVILETEDPCHATLPVRRKPDGLLHRLELSEELHDVLLGHSGTQPDHLN